MVSRRSFLGASASGTLVAIAGCIDSVPVLGNGPGAGGQSGAIESTESFLADPGLDSSIGPVPTSDTTESFIEAYDGSIAEHVGELSVDDLSNYGTWTVVPEAGADAIESNDHTTSARYRTYWQVDDPEGDQPRTGAAEGWVGHVRAHYDRDAYESALELSDSPDVKTNGYDLYTESDGQGVGLADDAILGARISNLYVPEKNVERSDRNEAARSLLERGASRSTSTESPPEWVQTVVDAVSPAHHIVTSRYDTPDGEDEVAHARSFHVDGTETTVALAEGATDAAELEDRDWTDGAAKEAVLASIARVTGKSRRDLDSVRKLLVESPTVEVGERHGVVSGVVPSAEVTNPIIG